MVFASCCVLRSGAEILEQTRKILMYEKAVSIKSPSVITGKDITSLGVVVMRNRPMYTGYNIPNELRLISQKAHCYEET